MFLILHRERRELSGTGKNKPERVSWTPIKDWLCISTGVSPQRVCRRFFTATYAKLEHNINHLQAVIDW